MASREDVAGPGEPAGAREAARADDASIGDGRASAIPDGGAPVGRPNELQLQTMLLQDDGAEAIASVVPPLYQTSLFTFGSFEEMRAAVAPDEPSNNGRYVYTRGRNPTTRAFEEKIAQLEAAEEACAFASGMAAIASAVLANVSAGDRIVCVRNVYPDTHKLMTTFLPRFGVETQFVDGGDEDEVRAALAAGGGRRAARVLYLESPTTQLFELQDIGVLAAAAAEHGALTILDNSWATPLGLRALEHGVDLVLHSASKYLGGHSDVIAGVVAGSSERIAHLRDVELMLLGGKLAPFDAWLLLRGLRTLPLRLERHRASATRVAEFLQEQPQVRRVHYPGLASHPRADLFARYYVGASGLLSFELSDEAMVQPFVDALRLFRIGVSWGGYESLVYPILLSHLSRDPHGAARAFDVPRSLVRLHVGLEDAADLLDDLAQALRRADEGGSVM